LRQIERMAEAEKGRRKGWTRRRFADEAPAARGDHTTCSVPFPEPDRDEGDVESTELHLTRLQAVEAVLEGATAASVADLGCGDGVLVKRLLECDRIERVVAIDQSASALTRLERGVPRAVIASGRLCLVHGSFVTRHQAADGLDAFVMLETIEHVDPQRLAALEQTVFGVCRPRCVVITTPNQEFNVLYGLSDGEFREPTHRFEWTRSKFESWSKRVARRFGFEVSFGGIGDSHPAFGSPSQLAHFTRI
jgi:small RNA 2'-O-methyltransferase